MLEARSITVAYGARQALSDASLTIASGEVVALCGPNGAGKSTLIGALTGDLRLLAGDAMIAGVSLSSLKPGELALKRATLEQAPALSAPFTVDALAGLGLSRDLPPEACEPVISAVLRDVGLIGRRTEPVSSLSGGQQRRAHLARVLAQLEAGRRLGEGHALILDEPTAGLDLAHQIDALEAAQAAAAKGAAVLVALHDLSLAAAYADRIALMKAGRIETVAPPHAALTAPILSILFDTPMSVFPSPGGALCVAPALLDPHQQGDLNVHRHEPLQDIQRQGRRV